MLDYFFSPAGIAIITLLIVYFFLIIEKPHKIIVVSLGAAFLIGMQVFVGAETSSQANALHFVSENLDMLIFIMGMMIMMGIVSQSGIFEAAAIWMVKILKGNPIYLLIGIGFLSYVLSVLLPNIPALLVLTPVILIVIRQLKLPFLPYIFVMITGANIAGAATPISDPTTYYLAHQLNLSFAEVFTNSGTITLLCMIATIIYTYLVFRKQLNAVKVDPIKVKNFKPAEVITNKRMAYIGGGLIIIVILLMALSELITKYIGITLENGTIAIVGGMIAVLRFENDMKKVLTEYIDREVILFFSGLFIIVGALKFTGVTESVAHRLVQITIGNALLLLFIVTMGSCLLSIFIDNVPYNIAMISILQGLQKQGYDISQLIRALNLGTSIGGTGSIIGAACNVCSLSLVEKDGFHVSFLQYLMIGLPLVIINGLITFGMLAL